MYSRVLIFMLLIAVCSSRAHAGDVWKITSLEWGIYSGQDMSNQGRSIHILRELLKEADIELIVEFYPWARSKRIAKRPDYVGYYPAWSEEVEDGFFASAPLDCSDLAAITYEDSGIVWRGLDALFLRPVGLISSYAYPEYVTNLMAANKENVDYSSNEESLARKLSQKRFTVALTDPYVMFTVADDLDIDNLSILKIVGSLDLVLAFRDSPENRRRNEVLMKLIKKRTPCAFQ